MGEYTHPAFGEINISMPEETRDLHLRMRRLEGKLEHCHFDSFNTVMWIVSDVFDKRWRKGGGIVEFKKVKKVGSDKTTSGSEWTPNPGESRLFVYRK